MGLTIRRGTLAALALSPVLAAIVLPPVAMAAAPAPVSTAATTNAEDARLMALFRDDAAREDALSPMSALRRTGRGNPAVFAQGFTAGRMAASRASIDRSLAALARIDRSKLSAERQISYDVFKWSRLDDRQFLAAPLDKLMLDRPMNHFYGLQSSFPGEFKVGGAARYDSIADYRHNILYLRAFPKVIDNAIVRWRDGERNGILDTRLTVTNMIAQIDGILAQSPADNPLYTPLETFPAGTSAADQAAMRKQWTAAIEGDVRPAYRKLRTFLHDEYLPKARAEVGLSAMKGGDALYRALIRSNTTLDMTPDAIHRLGLSEVARIQHEMEAVKNELGYSGPLKDFFEVIRTDPKYHPKTREELADGFVEVGKAVDAQIPRFFSRVPKARLQIEPYPPYSEKYEAGGSYDQGSPDGKRPGTFHYNTYDLPSRFLTGITTLYLHEGIPGHHFQISLAQEDTALPDFQRFGGNTAFVEGWALYAETLGYEMGFYKDPMQHWGTLDDEMLRAMRLVVDTGLHSKGWSREQAIDYMLANSGMGKSDATAEVERYIAIPGQALSYKLGSLTIQRLRKKAEAELGPRFDIRAFHEQVLGSGALPLPILETKIDRWIAAQKG
ncbi:DUF885 domain-containing protein [Parablastomonas sp. CN1-191]|uniref:DUF885 domain-containing protein n=1 Tax=Parablastomonas sp. CN1-191 TaxID=3400908 RepID=UPI003BF7C1E8